MKYAKVKDGKVKKIHDLTHRRRTIEVDDEKVVNPREEHYIRAGWLPVAEPPPPGPGEKIGRMIIDRDHVTWEVVPLDDDDRRREREDEEAMLEAEFPTWAHELLMIATGRATLAKSPRLKSLLARRKKLMEDTDV